MLIKYSGPTRLLKLRATDRPPLMSVPELVLDPSNVAYVGARIVDRVAEQNGIAILPQSPAAVRSILVREVRDWSDERSTIPSEGEPTTVAGVVAMLNERAIVRAARVCAETYFARVQYLSDKSTLPIPLAHGKNESVHGTHQGDYSHQLDL